jgi:hypothetical protein
MIVRCLVRGHGVVLGAPGHLRAFSGDALLGVDPVMLRNHGVLLPISFGTPGLTIEAHLAVDGGPDLPPAFRMIEAAEGWLDVVGGEIALRDLDELSDFNPTPPRGRSLRLADGPWRVEVRHQSSERDGEILLVFLFSRLDARPTRAWDDVIVLSYGGV